jgi:hypothetical protein
MKEAERELRRLEAARDRLAVDLAAASEHTELARVGAALADAEAALLAAEDRWLALAEEAER